MKYLIRAGRHRAFPPPVGLYKGRRSFIRSVVFTDSWAHAPEGEDYWDLSKVFGVGYLWGGHHRDSARFACRYSRERGKMEIHAYAYVNGERIDRYITAVPLNREVHLELYISNSEYWFGVRCPDAIWHTAASTFIPYSHKKKWQYLLGLYHGGTTPALVDLTTYMNPVPKSLPK